MKKDNANRKQKSL